MTTGPENPYGAPDPGVPPTHQPYGETPPTPPPYGAPQHQPYQEQPYPQPYQQQPYQQPYQQQGYPQPAYGQPPYPYAAAPPNDGLALGAMITGIASIVLSCAYGVGLLAAPVALVLGRVSMNRIKRSDGQLGGRGFALTGFILGIIGTILLVLAIIAVVVIVVVAINNPGAFDDTGTGTGSGSLSG
ncbi:DUF4190 domain-containing protein [Nocardioides sp. URHA0020]|uniref:DUF4190 domain-containing protein n=1 Tax=Nocardioides sp. URHA0020 TaxID=1380392 RepID=UPI000686625F|nr:DUF4190 domain-containing protein [Nocardioides sp. URHA0020]